MARLLSRTVNLSYKNYISTGFVFNKQYSVLCGYYKNNNDKFMENKYFPYQKIQQRNFVQEKLKSWANSWLCCNIRDFLLNFHQWSDLPWWATICLSTSTVRLLLALSTGVMQEKIHAELWEREINPKQQQKDAEKETLALAKKNNWTLEETLKIIASQNKEKKLQEWKRKLFLYYRRFILMLVQVGIWVTLSMSLNGLTTLALQNSTDAEDSLAKQYSTEGTLWFKDLTKPDKYYLLPGFLVCTNYIIIEVMQLQRGLRTTYLTYLVRLLVLWLAYVASIVPASMALYWVSSSFVALLQNLFFLSPRVRKYFKIDTLRIKDPNHPYKFLWKRFKIKWGIP